MVEGYLLFFSGGESVLSRESTRRQEFSLYRFRVSKQTRKECEERRRFFVFWLPRVKAFSSKFLDKKRDTPEREGGTTKWRERERDLVYFVSVFSFVG